MLVSTFSLVFIWMEFEGEGSVGLLDFRIGCLPFDP